MSEDSSFSFSGDPGMSRRGRRTDATKQRLLDAALAVFLERGYASATLGEVTARADLGVGTLYLHFRDKRSLLEGLARRALGALYADWMERAAGFDDPVDRVVSMIDVFVDFFAARPAEADLFLRQGPALEGWLVEEVGRGVTQVLPDAVRNPELLAHLVIGTGLAGSRLVLQHGFGSGRPASRRESAELRESLAAFVRGGLASALAHETRRERRPRKAHAPRSSRPPRKKR